MSEELLRKYQETISLLQYRMPGYTFYGDFEEKDGKYAFKLTYIKTVDASNGKHVYKYMPSREKALSYFVKTTQNRVF